MVNNFFTMCTEVPELATHTADPKPDPNRNSNPNHEHVLWMYQQYN